MRRIEVNSTTCFETGFRRLENTSAAQEGSIHDDEPARKLGFKGAFVPGSVVGTSAMPAILAHFGSDWMEGGWYDFNFVSPVYTSDNVRTVATPDGDNLMCRVETSDERLCCAGRAGLGYRAPWTQNFAAEDVFPDAHVGETFDEREIDITFDAVEPMLVAGADNNAPWNEFVHPEHLMSVALHAVDWLRVLASKGTSGRTHFVEFQFRLTDLQSNEVAVGRHKCKFIRAD
jgi:hypothetical protein